MEFFNGGLDLLDSNYESADLRWMLLLTNSFDPDDDTITAMLAAATEVSEGGYTRLAIDTPEREVDDGLHIIRYTAADPDFSGIDPGEDVFSIVLYLHVTDDDDSIPIGWQVFPDTIPSDEITTVEIEDGIIAYKAQAP